MSLDRSSVALERSMVSAIEDAAARTRALWPRAAASLGLPADGANFFRLRVNKSRASYCCALLVTAADGAEYVLRADFSEGGLAAFQNHLERHQAAAGGLEQVLGVSVPAIRWRDPERKFVLMDHAPGGTVYHGLSLSRYGYGMRSDLMQRLGRAVAALHSCSAAGTRRFWPKPYLENVSKSAQAVRSGEVSMLKPNRYIGFCAYLHRAGRRARGIAYQGALEHGDLHFRNILVSPELVSFIDFSNARSAVPQRDIANLWLSNGLHHLTEDRAEAGYGMVAAADWDAFEAGHGSQLREDPVFQFFFALRLWTFWQKLSAEGPSDGPRGARQLRMLIAVMDRLLADEPG